MKHLKPTKTKRPALVVKTPSLDPVQPENIQEIFEPYKDNIEEMIPQSAKDASKKILRDQDRYNRDNVRVIIRHLIKGMSQIGVADMIGVSAETFSRWKTKYPDFDAAVRQARALNREILINTVWTGMPKTPRMAMEMLGVLFPDEYAPTKRVEQSGSIAHTHGPNQLLEKLHQTRQMVDSADDQSVVVDVEPVDNKDDQ